MPHAHAEAGASELAARVCHEEQMTVWSGEIMGTLSIGGYLREDWSYEDTINASAAVAADIRSIVESALDHPELKNAALAPAAGPESVRRLSDWLAARAEAADKDSKAHPEGSGNRAFYAGQAIAYENALSAATLATPSSVQAEEAVSAPASAGAVPAGWRLVPIHETEEMWRAGHDADAFSGDSYSAVWDAMLAAAPATPEPAAGGAMVVDAVKRVLKSWHQDACYPNACEVDLEVGAKAVIATLSASTADGETAGDGWQDIGTVPEGVEVVVRGGKSVFGDALRGSSIAVIHDRANLYRPNGTLRPSSPTMWHRAPPPPTPTRTDATAEEGR